MKFLAVLSMVAFASQAHAQTCGTDSFTGKKKTLQLCEHLDEQTISFAGIAFAACGNYFIKGTAIETLSERQFTARRKSMTIRLVSSKSKEPIKISVSVKRGECVVSVSPTTTQDGRALGDQFFKSLKPLGFKKKLQAVNHLVANPKLYRGEQLWDMNFRIPVPTGTTLVTISPPN